MNNPGIPLVAIMANELSFNERGLDCELGFGLRDEALDPWYPWVVPYADRCIYSLIDYDVAIAITYMLSRC